MGRLQSHKVSPTLRSTPWGRGGFANGSSPLAILSVQSPKYLYRPAHEVTVFA
jgi:hypothetical protein